jgi:coenzyme PQQ precursor peptide PqqA
LAGPASTDQPEEFDMQWIDPAYADIRLGFEVTAYVYVR